MARLGSSDAIEPRASHAELIEGFDLSRFGRAPARFGTDDLDALNVRTLHAKPYAEVADRLRAAGVPDDLAEPFWLLIRENIGHLGEIDTWAAILKGGFDPAIDPEDAEYVARAMAALDAAKPWTAATWGAVTAALKAETGRKGKALFMPLRKALTGRTDGPDMASLLPLLRR